MIPKDKVLNEKNKAIKIKKIENVKIGKIKKDPSKLKITILGESLPRL